ncbi:MAG TPA: hypothetical protein VNQ90_03655, partial [Chthoniobacteraceae bacterium]|nr:hypothetical protein [Chthoniobacteraceae bacterium]
MTHPFRWILLLGALLLALWWMKEPPGHAVAPKEVAAAPSPAQLLYVSPHGEDASAEGTRQAPFATVAAALAR